MTVDTQKSAAASVYRGKTYHFCSTSCRDKFDREAEKDVVLNLGGKPVDDTATLISETAKLSPGQRMELEVLRQGKELRLSVIAGTRPASRVRK